MLEEMGLNKYQTKSSSQAGKQIPQPVVRRAATESISSSKQTSQWPARTNIFYSHATLGYHPKASSSSSSPTAHYRHRHRHLHSENNRHPNINNRKFEASKDTKSIGQDGHLYRHDGAHDNCKSGYCNNSSHLNIEQETHLTTNSASSPQPRNPKPKKRQNDQTRPNPKNLNPKPRILKARTPKPSNAKPYSLDPKP